MKTVAEGIKRSQTLPIGSTRTNFLSCYPNFRNEVEPFSKKLLDMSETNCFSDHRIVAVNLQSYIMFNHLPFRMSMLLRKENVKIDVRNCDSEEKIDLMVDGINKILDRVVSSH